MMLLIFLLHGMLMDDLTSQLMKDQLVIEMLAPPIFYLGICNILVENQHIYDS